MISFPLSLAEYCLGLGIIMPTMLNVWKNAVLPKIRFYQCTSEMGHDFLIAAKIVPSNVMLLNPIGYVILTSVGRDDSFISSLDKYGILKPITKIKNDMIFQILEKYRTLYVEQKHNFTVNGSLEYFLNAPQGSMTLGKFICNDCDVWHLTETYNKYDDPNKFLDPHHVDKNPLDNTRMLAIPKWCHDAFHQYLRDLIIHKGYFTPEDVIMAAEQSGCDILAKFYLLSENYGCYALRSFVDCVNIIRNDCFKNMTQNEVADIERFCIDCIRQAARDF